MRRGGVRVGFSVAVSAVGFGALGGLLSGTATILAIAIVAAFAQQPAALLAVAFAIFAAPIGAFVGAAFGGLVAVPLVPYVVSARRHRCVEEVARRIVDVCHITVLVVTAAAATYASPKVSGTAPTLAILAVGVLALFVGHVCAHRVAAAYRAIETSQASPPLANDAARVARVLP